MRGLLIVILVGYKGFVRSKAMVDRQLVVSLNIVRNMML